MPVKTSQREQPNGPIHFINQVALIVVGALVYFGVRGITEGSPSEAEALAERIFEFEQRIGLDLERGAQALVIDSATLTTLANWVYIWFHWPVIIATLIYLHRKHRAEYYTLRTALFASGLIGMIIFALFPVAPPRLLNEGFVDTVSDLSSSYRVLQPPALVNKYAALPSLHVGWNLLVAISVYRVSTRRIPHVLAPLSVVAMVLAVVITGNHWVVDAIAGSAVALVGLALARRIESSAQDTEASDEALADGAEAGDTAGTDADGDAGGDTAPIEQRTS